MNKFDFWKWWQASPQNDDEDDNDEDNGAEWDDIWGKTDRDDQKVNVTRRQGPHGGLGNGRRRKWLQIEMYKNTPFLLGSRDTPLTSHKSDRIEIRRQGISTEFPHFLSHFSSDFLN
jgi:hypothetical protein